MAWVSRARASAAQSNGVSTSLVVITMVRSLRRFSVETNSLIGDNRAAISEFSEQGLRQLGPAIVELRETLRSLRQVADRLSDSNSLLLGREQPKEFEPR